MLNDSFYLNMIDAPLFAVMQQLARAVIGTFTRSVAWRSPSAWVAVSQRFIHDIFITCTVQCLITKKSDNVTSRARARWSRSSHKVCELGDRLSRARGGYLISTDEQCNFKINLCRASASCTS